MPPKRSAGILLYRLTDRGPELLIAHMGGPFWRNRDERAWTIPKGEHGPDDDPLQTARREFAEELGGPAPGGDPIPLGEVRQSSGKVVTAWALEGDLDPTGIRSNTFTTEWPPGSGRTQEFPEIDRVAWVDPDTARRKLVAAQATFVDRLLDVLRSRS